MQESEDWACSTSATGAKQLTPMQEKKISSEEPKAVYHFPATPPEDRRPVHHNKRSSSCSIYCMEKGTLYHKVSSLTTQHLLKWHGNYEEQKLRAAKWKILK